MNMRPLLANGKVKEVEFVSLNENAIHQGDCLELLSQLEEASVDLAFADPPFNIGYDYDVYQDKQTYQDYLNWTKLWMTGVRQALKPTGTFWLAIGDEYAAELKLLAQNELGFACRSWVVWYYTFGVNCTRKFSRSHAHLFHFVRDPKLFTFNWSDPAVRVPSARQLVYADKRANPKGRLPDDTWILRPQDVPGAFTPDQDTVYFPRVAGTFKERAGFHGCQMPEQLLGRIIRVSSNVNDLVLDPFAGSGTTVVVAKKLGRRWIGLELSPEYARQASQRVKTAQVGSPLNGAVDPVLSAPATPSYSKPISNEERTAVRRVRPEDSSFSGIRKTVTEVDEGILRAYLSLAKPVSVDRLLADPSLSEAFVDACRAELGAGNPLDWNQRLLRLRKTKRLPKSDNAIVRRFSWEEMDSYSFASEIALQLMSHGSKDGLSLDDILCNPALAAQFDQIAESYAPGHSAFEYRWAALALRKKAKKIKATLLSIIGEIKDMPIPPAIAKSRFSLDRAIEGPGVYILRGRREGDIYVAETPNLRCRLKTHWPLLESGAWATWEPSSIRIIPTPARPEQKRQAVQLLMISRLQPRLNSDLLSIDSTFASAV